MVPSHRPVGFADGAALFPESADARNTVAAGINPAAKATLVTN